MKQKLAIIAMVLGGICSKGIAQTKANNTVFGVLKLGEALSVAECSKIEGIYSYIDSETCFEDSMILLATKDQDVRRFEKTYIGDRVHNPIKTGGIEILFMPKPSILKNVVQGQVIDGNLEYVAFDTLGVQDAEEVFATLKVKYGAPSEVHERKGKNYDWGRILVGYCPLDV